MKNNKILAYNGYAIWDQDRYNMIKNRTGYREAGLDYYDKLHKEKAVKNLRRFAERLGYTVAPQEPAKTASSNTQSANTLQCVI